MIRVLDIIIYLLGCIFQAELDHKEVNYEQVRITYNL